MFTGIIKNTGKISKIYKNSNNCIIEILSKIKFSKSEIGSSVSCSGTCLTLEKYKKNLSKFYISKETLNRNLINDFKLIISNKKLGKDGDGNIKKYFRLFLHNKKNTIEKVNLFGEKLTTYKLK